MATNSQIISNNSSDAFSSAILKSYECSSNIHKTTNERIYNRNIPSQTLQPYLDVRPVMTKYSIMPIVDPRAKINVPLQQQSVYSPEKVFNPGNARAPWSGFASAINTESELRNQVYALQACSQAVYVPSSQSDLYVERFHPKPITDACPYKELFKEEKFQAFNPNVENIGNALFNNYTRQEIRNIPSGKPNC